MTYLDHLPAVFRQGDFLGDFLASFEEIYDGEQGLQPRINRLVDLFDPDHAPEEFLPWLAGWVALTLQEDWSLDAKRSFIREVVPLYRQRGTVGGLQRMLQIYLQPKVEGTTRDDVKIFDDFDEPAHYFQVQLTLADSDPTRLQRAQSVARAIIDQEKPAHTFYALKIVIPTMRLVSLELQASEDPHPELLIMNTNTWLGTAG